MASEHPLHEFSNVAGGHRGATFTLGSGGVLVIGSDESCDICLSDAGIAPRHAMLMSQGAVVTVRQLDGEVEVDGTNLVAEPRATLEPGATVVSAACSCGSRHRPAWRTRRRTWRIDRAPQASPTSGSCTVRRWRGDRRREPDSTEARCLTQRRPASRCGGSASTTRARRPDEGRGYCQTTYGVVVKGVVEPAAATNSQRRCGRGSRSSTPS